jgi:hypothetical protein
VVVTLGEIRMALVHEDRSSFSRAVYQLTIRASSSIVPSLFRRFARHETTTRCRGRIPVTG